MPTAPAPFKVIANDITAKIKSGELSPGTKLPSTRELAEQYGVSPNTAYRAMSILHERNLVVGRPGRGVYVADDLSPNPE